MNRLAWSSRVQVGRTYRETPVFRDTIDYVVLNPTWTVPPGAEVVRLSLALAAPGGRPELVYYTKDGDLAGVRRGRWKLLLEGPQLFDVEADVSETRDRAAERPELVESLTAIARQRDAEIEAAARPRASVERTLFDPERP
mgnify:CR=1 FL=1